jgi:predicted PurR-regulated permease PerM
MKLLKEFNSIIKKHLYLSLLIAALIFIVFYVLNEKVQEYYKSSIIEGFDAIGDIKNTVNDIKNLANSIPNEVKNIGNSIKNTENLISNSVTSATGSITGKINTIGSDVSQGFEKVKNTTKQVSTEIEDKLVKFGKEIETKTNDLVINKIKSFFDQLGNIFEIAIVVPFKTLFVGLGDVFLQIFEIIKMIGDKIISLPSCIFIYGIKTFVDTVNKIYAYIIPSFIRNFITSIYNFLFKWLVDYMLKWIGYTGAVQRCYGFNVNDKVDNMNNTFKNISRTFNSSFGNVKNYKIQI